MLAMGCRWFGIKGCCCYRETISWFTTVLHFTCAPISATTNWKSFITLTLHIFQKKKTNSISVFSEVNQIPSVFQIVSFVVEKPAPVQVDLVKCEQWFPTKSTHISSGICFFVSLGSLVMKSKPYLRRTKKWDLGLLIQYRISGKCSVFFLVWVFQLNTHLYFVILFEPDSIQMKQIVFFFFCKKAHYRLSINQNSNHNTNERMNCAENKLISW